MVNSVADLRFHGLRVTIATQFSFLFTILIDDLGALWRSDD
jgi:hypothetical protein